MTTISSNSPLAYLGIQSPQSVAKVVTSNIGAPTSADFRYDLGTIWVYGPQNEAYILTNKDNNYAKWFQLAEIFDFYPSVISQTTEALAVKTVGNRYIASATSGDWIIDNIYEWTTHGWLVTFPTAGSITFDENLATYLLYDGANWNSLLSAFALGDLSDVTIAAVADDDVLMYDLATTDWVNGKVANANIAAAAAIDYSKLAALASANILVGSAANVATVVAMSGDISIDNLGATTILSMTSPIVNTSMIFDQTTADYTLTWADPAVARALSWDDPLGDDKFVFRAEAVTLSNKTLTAPDINGGTVDSLTSLSIRSTASAFDVLQASSEILTANRTLTWSLGDAARVITLSGNITTAGDLITNGAFSLTLTQTAATNVTLPTTGTLATLAGMETLTTKTINADSNTIQNINADEFDPVAQPTAGNHIHCPEFILYVNVSNATITAVYNANAPFKFEIIDVWAIDYTGSAGNWKLNDDVGGIGTDITNAVGLGGIIYEVTRVGSINTSVSTIAAGGDLSVITAGGTEDIRVYIKCIRVD